MFLNYLLLLRTDELNVNVQDGDGNTPLHSIVMNGVDKSDRDQCLDALETLINNGATPDIRNSAGYLPVDYYRTFDLERNNDEIDRGELLLRGEMVTQRIKREKPFLIIVICVVIGLWIWLNLTLVKQLYIQENSTKCLKSTHSIKINWYVSHSQIITIFFMNKMFLSTHRCSGQLYFLTFYKRFVNASILSMMYSGKLYCEFLSIITLALVVFRGLCNLLGQSQYADILFHLFCAFLCLIYVLFFLQLDLHTRLIVVYSIIHSQLNSFLYCISVRGCCT